LIKKLPGYLCTACISRKKMWSLRLFDAKFKVDQNIKKTLGNKKQTNEDKHISENNN